MRTMAGVPEGAVGAVAALNDPVRRALFDAVRRAPGALSREEAGAAVGVSRKLAAFHLDKLVDVGLLALDIPPEPAAPRSGRVGRRPKRYRPADTAVQISIPPRRVNLLADMLLEGIRRAREGDDPIAATLRVARERGAGVGHRERPQRARRLSAERALSVLHAVLERLGYEPTRHGTGPVQFGSCPFHPMSADSPDLVCGIHHAYVSGLVEGLELTSVEAALAPGSGGCCVELRPGTRA
jgi:predicted ArsR family transcriptional regulator